MDPMLARLAVFVALLAGSGRALLLWRATVRMDAVNAATVLVFGEGREAGLSSLMRGAGRAPYLDAATLIADAARRLATEEGSPEPSPRALRNELRREASRAVIVANQRLRRHAWLDGVTVVALGLAGAASAIGGSASLREVLAVIAGTLLWLANLLALRSLTVRMSVAASALAESLAEVILERRHG